VIFLDTDYDFVLLWYHHHDSYIFRTFIIVYYFIKLVTCHVVDLVVLTRKHIITCVLLHSRIGVVLNAEKPLRISTCRIWLKPDPDPG